MGTTMYIVELSATAVRLCVAAPCDSNPNYKIIALSASRSNFNTTDTRRSNQMLSVANQPDCWQQSCHTRVGASRGPPDYEHFFYFLFVGCNDRCHTGIDCTTYVSRSQ